MPIHRPRRLVVPILILLSAVACTAPQAEEGADAPQAAEDSEPAAFQPSPGEREAIVATLQTLFDALETGDGELFRSVVVPDLVMRFAEESNGETTLGTATVEAMATRIETSEVPLIERMWDPVVRVDGAVATLWAPYDFYAGPDFSHCGVDTAILLRGEEGWRITALSWTRRQPPACAQHPDGPPAG